MGAAIADEDFAPFINRKCAFGRTLAQMDPASAEVVTRWVARPSKELTSNRVSQVLREKEWIVNQATISRHRKGECGCERSNIGE